jgi:hypothetical protein
MASSRDLARTWGTDRKSVLVALDKPPAGKSARETALRLAARHRAKITALSECPTSLFIDH